MTVNAKTEKRYWIHAVTPLHVGSGRGVGYIDLPVAREKVTNWPYIPGSAVKGVVADHFGATDAERKANALARAAFGTANDGDTTEANSTAGSLVFTDARIVCLPIRSFYGTFAWVTSPFCLERLKRDLRLELPALRTKAALLTSSTRLAKEDDPKLYLEDLDLDTSKSEEATAYAQAIAGAVFADRPEWQTIFCERFAVVSDDIFTFLSETGTQVDAHIRIEEETGVVASGALWYEESLPVETVLAGTVWCDRVYAKKGEKNGVTKGELLSKFCGEPLGLQIGGKASTGKGRVRCLFELFEANGTPTETC